MWDYKCWVTLARSGHFWKAILVLKHLVKAVMGLYQFDFAVSYPCFLPHPFTAIGTPSKYWSSKLHLYFLGADL